MKASKCNRREFLKAAGLSAACAAFSWDAKAQSTDRRTRPPNILFCIADDWS